MTVALLAALSGAPASAVPGDLDPSFGQGGHVRVQANARCLRGCAEFAGSYANALALQSDGDIVLGGSDDYMDASLPSQTRIPGALVRLLPSGALDQSFGAAGIEGTPFDVQQLVTNGLGGLVATGSLEAGKIGVSRYTSGGVLDGAFGQQGVRWMPQPTGSVQVRRDRRGRVLALASFTRNSVDLVRYLPSGELDLSFGHGGYVGLSVPNGSHELERHLEITAPPEAKPTALAIQADGGLYAAFEAAPFRPSESTYQPPEYFVEHLSSSGRLDRTFARKGVLRLPGDARAMAIAPNGHLFAAWAEPSIAHRPSEKLQGIGLRPAWPWRLALAQYAPNGRIDRAFGKAGVVLSRALGGPHQSLEPQVIGFDQDDVAIVVGELRTKIVDVTSGTAFIARATRSGLDCAFGDGGVIMDPEMGGASAVAVQRDGRTVVAGWSAKAFAAARYLGGGPRRTCPN